MITDTRGALDVPGATLTYDLAGTGPLLLLVPGGAMESPPFAGLQDALADRFTVVRYRRPRHRREARSPATRTRSPSRARPTMRWC